MTQYTLREYRSLPRLPLTGNLDLTYRCNNACRHCWLWLPENAREIATELSYDEICHVVDEARALGCQTWGISGGEPMLRPDFADILDYITRKCIGYRLNTNGTLITPEIARLLTRRGMKAVALYGATAAVHDDITRNPGSFDATLRGFAYLKEAGADFIVQLVPLRGNFDQWQAMIALAESLSPKWRVGASWLYLSACGSPAKNREIQEQRLDAQTVVTLDPPDPTYESEWAGDDAELDIGGSATERDLPEADLGGQGCCGPTAKALYSACITSRREFHLDPYGMMTFCPFVKDPALRYNVRTGSFREGWDEFIPSLVGKVHDNPTDRAQCKSCAWAEDCQWCPAYAYLEHGCHSSKVDYLCQIAEASTRYREDWLRSYRRYFQIAGITLEVDSDLPITDQTFSAEIRRFQVAAPGDDLVRLRHRFSIPSLEGHDLGKLVYSQVPWKIYHRGGTWFYLGVSDDMDSMQPHRVAVFNEDHSRGQIFNDSTREEYFRKGNLTALTMFGTDQVLLARLLADRQAFYLHAAGLVLDGQGLVFVGHSTAGKSTTTMMLQPHAKILCDDRVIVRRWPDGFRVHGTWSHGDVAEVSPDSAPLRALLLLEKAPVNRLERITNPVEITRLLPPFVVRSLATADWWHKTLDLISVITKEVPVYRMQFDKTGEILHVLRAELLDPGKTSQGSSETPERRA